MDKKVKNYSEAELIALFGLQRMPIPDSDLMDEWTAATTTLSEVEQPVFDRILDRAKREIVGWKEEALKMNFIAFVLDLGHLNTFKDLKTYYDEAISATVEGHFLKTKSDFMLAQGILDLPQVPYFHFQEWKKHKDPNGDPTAQLIEAFIIAQEKNKNGLPMYGATVVGKIWEFYIMEGKTYYISNIYDCTDRDDLMKIIAMLRKFRWILENRFL